MNILHLSDIHFGRNNPSLGIKDNFTKRDKILDELIEIVAGMEEELRPEHVVFTGDIAWHGKSSEYREALQWFRRFLSAAGLTGKDISFCAGNHDIDLSCLYDDPSVNDFTIGKIDEYYKYKNVQAMDFPLYGYNEFCRDLGVEPYSYPVDGEIRYSYSVGYKDVSFTSGKTIRLVGFNTALMLPFENISDDKMWLGQEQIKSLMKYGILPAPKNIWYTIALCHHSDRFLHPEETSTYNGRVATLPLLLDNVNLILCGHAESNGIPRLSKQAGGGTILRGGAAYYSDDHINAFSMIYLSESRHTMGFLPYVYEGSWVDYDFEQNSIIKTSKEIHLPEDDGYTYYNDVRVSLDMNGEEFIIPCRHMRIRKHSDCGDALSLDNDKDILNPFRVSYGNSSDGKSISITLNPCCAFSARDNLQYRRFTALAEVCGTPDKIKCSITTSGGLELLSSDNCCYADACCFDSSFIEEIYYLEEAFNVRFRLPETVKESDYTKISVLKKFLQADYEGAFAEATSIDNSYSTNSKQSCRIKLFGAAIDLAFAL